ncbi:hypothetical protein [Halobaculum sp. D14]|uniref:hypothetical protein n=1 Tax=unclassified Halobaculum TaxID=2640896 RepID=UPI003EC07D32
MTAALAASAVLAVAVTLLSSPAGAESSRTLAALAREASRQYEVTAAAVRFASLPVAPAVFGGALGVGGGLIAGAAVAYRGRGMR